MKVKDYMEKADVDFELTCWDSVVDSEFYLYRKDEPSEYDKEFPNVEKCMDYLMENLEVVKIHKHGVEVNLYEMLDKPAIIQYAKDNMFVEWQYDCDEDVVMMLFDDMISNINNGYEGLSRMFMEAFSLVEQTEVKKQTYKIPVVYQMWGLVDVEATSLEEAVKYAKNHIDELPLPKIASYIDESYEIDEEAIAIHNREHIALDETVAKANDVSKQLQPKENPQLGKNVKVER